MKYNIILCLKVEKALKEKEIDQKIIDSITEIVNYFNDSGFTNIPMFNGINFTGIKEESKNEPLKVEFSSNCDNVDYHIELQYYPDKIVICDLEKNIELTFSKEKDIYKFVYGDNVLLFEGFKSTGDSVISSYIKKYGGFSKVRLYIFTNTNNLDLCFAPTRKEDDTILVYEEEANKYLADYQTFEILPRESGTAAYFKVPFSCEKDQDEEIAIKFLNKLENCFVLAIDYYNYIYEKRISKLDKVGKKKVLIGR